MPEEIKTPMAAVLEYDKERDAAPRVTAKGRGMVAEKIIALAKRHDIPIKTDPALVQVLCTLDLDDQIPVELYKAVAEILAFVYSVNAERRDKGSG